MQIQGVAVLGWAEFRMQMAQMPLTAGIAEQIGAQTDVVPDAPGPVRSYRQATRHDCVGFDHGGGVAVGLDVVEAWQIVKGQGIRGARHGMGSAMLSKFECKLSPCRISPWFSWIKAWYIRRSVCSYPCGWMGFCQWPPRLLRQP